MNELTVFLSKISAFVFVIVVWYLVITTIKKRNNFFKDVIKFTSINKKYQLMQQTANQETLNKKKWKEIKKQQNKSINNKHKSRMFVLVFNGDKSASVVEKLREEVTVIIMTATLEDKVLVKLESKGGLWYSYGYAANQLQRIRDCNITLIVAIDKVAASGGYMMACVANKILAAPFSMIGSIGTLAEIPNFNAFLERHGIYTEQISGGDHKIPISILGKNTEEGRNIYRKRIEESYILFKDFVSKYRPMINIDLVGTGEVWNGVHAKDKGLVDEIITSDDYIVSAMNDANIFQVEYISSSNKNLIGKIIAPIKAALT